MDTGTGWKIKCGALRKYIDEAHLERFVSEKSTVDYVCSYLHEGSRLAVVLIEAKVQSAVKKKTVNWLLYKCLSTIQCNSQTRQLILSYPKQCKLLFHFTTKHLPLTMQVSTFYNFVFYCWTLIISDHSSKYSGCQSVLVIDGSMKNRRYIYDKYSGKLTK